jgi:hypothetical protein
VSSLIVCEGISDKNFLKLFLNSLGFVVSDDNFLVLGNKSNFFKIDSKKYKQLLIDIELEKINKILFVIDADSIKNDVKYCGYDNTKSELVAVIKKLQLQNYDTFIVCGPETKVGYLESLILSTINKEQGNCITEFLKCSDFKSKENHKAVLHQIYKQGFPNTPYDFSHSNFDTLKQKLQDLFNE